MKPSRIAVVGLGVAGTTAALLLARQGHFVTLFEQTPNPGPVGAGILLQPSGQLVLRKLGLLDSIIAHAEPIDRLHALTHRRSTLINLPYAQLGPNIRAYGLHRGTLFGALHNELQQTSATLRLGIRAVRYAKSPHSATLFDDSAAALGEFDFILACDGAQSALRGQSPADAAVHEYSHGALWTVGSCPSIRGHLLQITHGSRRMCGLLPMGQGRCSLFWSLERSEHHLVLGRGFDAWREDVLALCPQAGPIFEEARSFDQTKFTGYLHVHMPRPFDDACVFLGDAAHAMSPHLGQGINLALLDAYIFAQSVAAAGTFTEVCYTYAQARHSHLRVYSAVTRLLSPFFQSKGHMKGLLRDIFLPLMPRISPVRREMILTMSGLRAGWMGGKISL